MGIIQSDQVLIRWLLDGRAEGYLHYLSLIGQDDIGIVKQQGLPKTLDDELTSLVQALKHGRFCILELLRCCGGIDLVNYFLQALYCQPEITRTPLLPQFLDIDC